MPTLTLVAGKDTADLAKFLNDRGSVDVEHQFESLVAHEEELMGGFFQDDKFVYVSREGNKNLVKDLQVLRNLILGKQFFYPREIQFFLVTGETNEEVDFVIDLMDFLQSKALQDPNIVFPPYKINQSPSDMSFTDIYSILMGTAEIVDIPVSLDAVFRVERNSDSKKAYEANDTSDRVYEPFNFKRLDLYGKYQKTAELHDSGERFSDEEGVSLDKTDPNFPDLDIPEEGLKRVVLFSGMPRTGVSTYLSALAYSVVGKGHRVLILDLSENQGMPQTLEAASVPFEEINLLSFLSSNLVDLKKGITLLRCEDLKMALALAQNVKSNLYRIKVDTLLIDIGRNIYGRVHDLFKSTRPQSILVTGRSRYELEYVSNMVNTDRIMFMLSGYAETPLSPEPVANEDIKLILPNQSKIVMPIVFKALIPDPSLADRMLGV